ncbi:MAG: hypothetical protein ACXWXY_03300, partial [Aeromicrobium sp.]
MNGIQVVVEIGGSAPDIERPHPRLHTGEGAKSGSELVGIAPHAAVNRGRQSGVVQVRLDAGGA